MSSLPGSRHFYDVSSLLAVFGGEGAVELAAGWTELPRLGLTAGEARVRGLKSESARSLDGAVAEGAELTHAMLPSLGGRVTR